jgi:hypothetical protein
MLCISFSCNQVNELQEPDPFATTEDLPSIIIQSVSDSVEINVLELNKINVPVSLDFEQPAHGSIVRKEGSQRFFYIPHRTFFGKDSIAYRICREASCRRGRVMVEKKRDPSRCYPVYSSPDTSFINIPSGPGRKAIPLFPGDVYCTGNTRSFNSTFSGLGNLNISDSIRFNSSFSRAQKRSFLLSYSNTDQYLGVRNRYIRLSLIPDDRYCDDYFRVEDRETSYTMGRADSLLISYKTFIPLVQVCEGDLDTNYFQPSVSPNLILKPLGNQRFKVCVKAFSPQGHARLFFRYRNLRGIQSIGQMRILIFH